MTDEELIAELREWAFYAAADRIELLVKERDQWIEHTKNAVWADSEELKLANSRAERLQKALHELVNAFAKKVDVDQVRWGMPYEHPLSAYDRAVAALQGVET
jgi:hypothetical protein